MKPHAFAAMPFGVKKDSQDNRSISIVPMTN
jgi:hypothetical protein